MTKSQEYLFGLIGGYSQLKPDGLQPGLTINDISDTDALKGLMGMGLVKRLPEKLTNILDCITYTLTDQGIKQFIQTIIRSEFKPVAPPAVRAANRFASYGYKTQDIANACKDSDIFTRHVEDTITEMESHNEKLSNNQ